MGKIGPMHEDCKVSVLVPAYNESAGTVLDLLESLAGQMSVKPEEYEAVVVVNNSREEARKGSKEFKTNQKLIETLTAIRDGRMLKLPGVLLGKISKITASGINVRALDFSSAKKAKKINNVGAARDLGAREICRRFINTRAGLNGVIGLLDADCRVSTNYISELIRTFSDRRVNGAAGKWFIEIDKNLSSGNLLLRALKIHFGPKALVQTRSLAKKRQPVLLQKKDKLARHLLVNGQNMAVRAESWIKAGGMPHWRSFEDLVFGSKVTDLPGDVAYNPNYHVVALARPSRRVGMTGMGRRVGLMVRAARDCHRGKTEGLHVPNLQNLFQFFVKIFLANANGQLHEANIRKYFTEHGVQASGFSKQEIRKIARLVTEEFDGPGAGLSQAESAMEKLYAHFPGQKVM